MHTSPASGRHPNPARVLLRSLLASVLLCLLLQPAHAATTVRVAFLGDIDGDGWRGARQGIDEANVQGRFLGLSYELVTVDDVGQDGVSRGEEHSVCRELHEGEGVEEP